MKMHDISYEWSTLCSSEKSSSEKSDYKKRKEYPCLYIRGKELPELEVSEDGYGVAKIKFRVLGYREPSEGEKTLELEVHEIGSEGAAEGTEEKKKPSKKDTVESLDESFEEISKKDGEEEESEEEYSEEESE